MNLSSDHLGLRFPSHNPKIQPVAYPPSPRGVGCSRASFAAQASSPPLSQGHSGVLPYRRPSAGNTGVGTGGHSWVSPDASPRTDRMRQSSFQAGVPRPLAVSQPLEYKLAQGAYGNSPQITPPFPSAVGPEVQGLWRVPSPFVSPGDVKAQTPTPDALSHVVTLGQYASMAGAQTVVSAERPSLWRRRTTRVLIAIAGAGVCVATVALVVLARANKLHFQEGHGNERR